MTGKGRRSTMRFITTLRLTRCANAVTVSLGTLFTAAFGLHKSDPRLIVLGFTGVAASLLVLARIRRTTAIRPSTAPRRAV